MKRHLTIVFFFISLSSLTQAGALTISPVSLQMTDAQQTTSMTLKNDSGEETNIQIRVFKWTQENGNDAWQETSDITISPPSIKLEANRSYNVRIFRNTNRTVGTELAYRVIIDEIPRPSDARATGQGVKVNLRTSHPLFITNQNAIVSLSWQLRHDNGGWSVSARNAGGRHAQLTDVYLVDRNTKSKLALKINSVNGYILAAGFRDYEINGRAFIPQQGHQYAIEAKINGKSVATNL